MVLSLIVGRGFTSDVGLPGLGGDQVIVDGPGTGDSQPECAVSVLSTKARKLRTRLRMGAGVGATSLILPRLSAGGS